MKLPLLSPVAAFLAAKNCGSPVLPSGVGAARPLVLQCQLQDAMTDAPAGDEALLEVISPENTHRSVPITELPFAIGRGEVGNQLAIPDRRISRNCAVILGEGEQYVLEDRGNQLGIFVNGERVAKRALQEGDVVTFGLENSYQIIFHCAAPEITIENLLSRMGSISVSETSPIGLGKLNLLLEATMLLHSQLPLDAVLESMLDRAIAVSPTPSAVCFSKLLRRDRF